MKQSLASDAVKLTTSKIITMLISVISAMLLSRYRTLEEYGTYSQLLLVVNLVTTVFMLGLPNSINYFLSRAENDEEKQKFLSVYYTLSTFLSLLTGIVLVLSTPLVTNYFDNPLIRNFMFILAILPWANIILSSIENILIVYHRTTNLVLFRVINSISLLLIIVVVEVLSLSFTIYMVLFLSVEALFAIYVYLIVRKVSGKLKLSFDRNLTKKIFSFSIPLGLATMVGVLSVELDKLIIGMFFSTEELAIYTNAAREMPLAIVASSLTAVLMPQLVRLLTLNKKKEAVKLWGDTILLSYIIICFFSIALFVFAPEVISLMYSEKYLPGVTVFRIYSLVLLLRFTYFGIILNSMGKTKFVFYSSLASLILNLVLSYLFYLYIGYIGPAVATFISLLLVAFFQIIITAKTIDISIENIFPWRELGNITFLNITLGLGFAYFKTALPIQMFVGEIIESIILGFIWIIIYFIVMLKKIKIKWKNLKSIN